MEMLCLQRHEDAITRYLQSEAVSEGGKPQRCKESNSIIHDEQVLSLAPNVQPLYVGIQDLLCGKLTQACPIAVSKEEL